MTFKKKKMGKMHHNYILIFCSF